MSSNTKERILTVALKLFAQNGFLGTSMKDIASELQITKAALYKHYSSKQEIFESIMQRMNEADDIQAKKLDMPTENGMSVVTIKQLGDFALAQFKYWTEDDFACTFRKLLTIEQYRSERMQNLYQQYLAEGQLLYVESIFESMKISNAKAKALEFFSPLFLCYSLADKGGNTKELFTILQNHFDTFTLNN